MILNAAQRRQRQALSGLEDHVRIRDCSPGRDLGSKTMPIDVRAVVGTLANLELDTNSQPTTNKELATVFDLHPNQVSSAKHGKIGSREDEELKKKIDGNLGVVNDVAFNKLIASLNKIDDKALDKCKAPDLARVASSMASIMDKTLPRSVKNTEEASKNNVRVLIHNMGQHKEEHYAVIEVEV